MTRRVCVLLMLLPVMPRAVVAGAQTVVPLTIEDAVARARAHAPRLQAERAREAAAEAAIEARAALGRPAVTTSAGFLRTNHVDEFGLPQPNGTTRVIFPDIPSNYRARVEVAVPLYTSGRVGDLVAAAEASRRAAGADTRLAEADLTLGVVSSYWTLVLARERVRVLTRALARADAQLEVVRARVTAGVLSPNDVLSAQAQRARQRVALVQAENDVAAGEADLARWVGLPPGQSIEPTSSADVPSAEASTLVAETPARVLARALEGRPERRGLVERQASLRLAAEAALAARRPQVGLLAAVEPARPNPRFVPRTDAWNTAWDLGVSVSWAVWDGGRARAERAGAAAEADALGHRLAEFDEGVGVELQQRRLDVVSSRAAVTASDEAVTAAAEARRVVGERFSAGVATSTEVLEADLAWLEAELERTRLLVTLRVSEARLVRAVGHPS